MGRAGSGDDHHLHRAHRIVIGVLVQHFQFVDFPKPGKGIRHAAQVGKDAQVRHEVGIAQVGKEQPLQFLVGRNAVDDDIFQDKEIYGI